MAPIQNDSDSLFHLEKISQYVSLPPSSLATPLPALCASIFSPILLTYYPPVRGIVLGYQKVQLSDEPPASQSSPQPTSQSKRKRSQREAEGSEDRADEDREESDEDDDDAEGKELLLRVVDEYSAPFLWATAEFLVWRPKEGVWVEGQISHQSSTHITLSHLNAFSISVLRLSMPDGWQYNPGAGSKGRRGKGTGNGNEDAEEGYWMDADGMPVVDVLSVRIRNWSAVGRGLLKIEGSFISDEEERAKRKAGGGLEMRRKSALKANSSLERNGLMEPMEVE